MTHNDQFLSLLHDSRERISAAIVLADSVRRYTWIPVHEALPPVAPGDGPEISETVLCALPRHYPAPVLGYVLHFASGNHVWRLANSPSDWSDSVTHWMPLPRMP